MSQKWFTTVKQKQRNFYLNIPISNHENFYNQLKKMERPVTFQTKKILSFPEFSVNKDIK